MPGSGTLKIATSTTELDGEFLKEYGVCASRPYVTITMSDSGNSMDDENRSHVFEPFFTTKNVGEGTGLGLGMVYGLVKQSEGYITVESEQGAGTVFELHFPVVQGRVDEAPETATRFTSSRSGTKTILVVEDDEHVRQVAVSLLTEMGNKVIASKDGSSAMEELEKNSTDVDLVFTDLIMPGMSGVDLARLVRIRYPEINVLMTSSYTDKIIAKREIDGSGFPLVRKPYKKTELAEAIQSVLTQ